MQMTPDFATLFVKMLAGLILVLGLAVVLVRFFLPRARWGRRRVGWAEVVDRLVLEPRKSLYLVKVAERYLLLGASDHALHLVGELSRTEGEKIEGK